MDGGPGAGQQLPLVPGQAGVQAVHQTHHQGQHQVTSQPVVFKAIVRRDFFHLVSLSPITSELDFLMNTVCLGIFCDMM